MTHEVTVRPKAETAHQKTVETQFSGYQKQIKPIEAAGLPECFVPALNKHRKAGVSHLKAAADLAAKGATAATDIGQGDEESGEKIQAC